MCKIARSKAKGYSNKKNSPANILFYRQMSDLQNEIDRYSYRSDTKDEEITPPPPPIEERDPSPPPLPPPVCGTPPTAVMHLQKPSLPEPEGPPPPPPIQNGYAFNTPILPKNHNNQSKEPIYESIKPRPEPLGGSGDEMQQEYGFPKTNGINSRNKIYGTLPDPDREARRVLRVQRELERIQEAEDEKEEDEQHFNLIEFAENYFNEHEKSPHGTLVGTLKRSKTTEWLSKTEMISYYKGNSIPNSHIHLFDPENVNLACNIFKVRCKFYVMLFININYSCKKKNIC